MAGYYLGVCLDEAEFVSVLTVRTWAPVFLAWGLLLIGKAVVVPPGRR
jgi:hypothetical protein